MSSCSYHFLLSDPARVLDSWVSFSGGVLIYCWYVSLYQWPSILICRSSMPAFFALVAALIRKLWVLKWSRLRYNLSRILSRDVLRIYLVNILLSLRINNGPGWSPLTAKNGRIAVIRQIVDAVLPRPNVTPCLKGPVLDCFIFTVRSWGLALLSIARSVDSRWMSLSKASCDGTVNSLLRRNPKKARQQAAHIIMLW